MAEQGVPDEAVRARVVHRGGERRQDRDRHVPRPVRRDAGGDVSDAAQDQRRQEAERASDVESKNIEAARPRPLRVEDGGDEEARDDEEDVDSDIASWQSSEAIVIQDHESHSDGSQAIDVGPVV